MAANIYKLTFSDIFKMRRIFAEYSDDEKIRELFCRLHTSLNRDNLWECKFIIEKIIPLYEEIIEDMEKYPNLEYMFGETQRKNLEYMRSFTYE